MDFEHCARPRMVVINDFGFANLAVQTSSKNTGRTLTYEWHFLKLELADLRLHGSAQFFPGLRQGSVEQHVHFRLVLA